MLRAAPVTSATLFLRSTCIGGPPRLNHSIEPGANHSSRKDLPMSEPDRPETEHAFVPPTDSTDMLEQTVPWKVTLRLVPFLFLLYVVNILDRVNVGFARLQMLDDLQLGEGVYALGAGIFYVGYLAFEVPSNLILSRTGARRWLARIMVSWGLITCATMAVTGPWGFCLLRAMLGVAEAG